MSHSAASSFCSLSYRPEAFVGRIDCADQETPSKVEQGSSPLPARTREARRRSRAKHAAGAVIAAGKHHEAVGAAAEGLVGGLAA